MNTLTVFELQKERSSVEVWNKKTLTKGKSKEPNMALIVAQFGRPDVHGDQWVQGGRAYPGSLGPWSHLPAPPPCIVAALSDGLLPLRNVFLGRLRCIASTSDMFALVPELNFSLKYAWRKS